MTTTAQRSTFVTALAKVDDAIKAERQPITRDALALALVAARASWASWSPARRPKARADLQAAMAAELVHARSDFLRIVARHRALDLFDLNDPGNDPVERYRLPREQAAAHASNAITHASIQTRLVSDDLRRLRGQRREAVNQIQGSAYRASWAAVAEASHADLVNLIKRRRRDWQRALVLIGEYQKAAA